MEQETGLDQFAGSAVSGIAAINKDRNMILIEKNEKTYNAAKQRLERET